MRFRGIVYRAIDPRWQGDPLSGHGALRIGGRFNPKGTVALYAALRSETTLKEVGFSLLHRPVTLVAYEVDVADILDLRDAAVRRHHFAQDEDADPHWLRTADTIGIAPSQAIAGRLIAQGHAGILVPSYATGATPDDLNLVLWRWGPDLPHLVRVIDDQGRLGVTPRPRA